MSTAPLGVQNVFLLFLIRSGALMTFAPVPSRLTCACPLLPWCPSGVITDRTQAERRAAVHGPLRRPLLPPAHGDREPPRQAEQHRGRRVEASPRKAKQIRAKRCCEARHAKKKQRLHKTNTNRIQRLLKPLFKDRELPSPSSNFRSSVLR